MTYADLASQPGKRAVQIVELHLTACSRVYGTAPCAAVLGVTGADRCLNTRGTCQDSANFGTTTKVYRFASTRVDGIQAPGDGPTFPTLLACQSAPTVLTPGEGLGVRSSLSVTIQDHPFSDAGVDPYRSLRSFDWEDRGSFWARFITQNKFYQNRRIDVLTGYLNEDGSYDPLNFKRRTYIISKISGPSVNGTVTIEGKDPLKLADGEKAQWPKASTATLTSAMTNVATTLPITDPDQLITEWWTAGGRYIRIENEIMLATAISGSATTSPSLTVTRASMPSWYDFSVNVAAAHAAEASVQPCWLYDGMVYDIVYHLLGTVASIPVAYLPYADWKNDIDNGFQYLSFRALLTDPVSVKDLLVELTKLNVLVWWDERSSVVRLKGFRFRESTTADISDEANIIDGTFACSDNTGALVTQAWLFYDVNWPLANPELLSTYRVTDVRANLSREGDDEYAASYIKKTMTRWLHRSDNGTAASVNQTLVRQYQDVRKIVTVALDPKDDAWWTGDTISLQSRYIRNEYGEATPRNYLVTQVEEQSTEAGVRYRYTLLEQFAFLRTGLITPDGESLETDSGDVITDESSTPITLDGSTFPDYTAASESQKDRYAFIAYDDRGDGQPGFLDGTEAYQIV